MGVKAPFDVLARVCGADEAQKKLFLLKFRGLQHEPIVVTEWRDESYQKQVFLRTKHEIISEIYFREHPEIDKNELMMEWCDNTCFGSSVESQALVNVFGAKKNYFADEAYINYELLINYLLKDRFTKELQQFRKLYETLHLARFWILLSQGKENEAIEVLNASLALMPYNLHSRTELAKIYQRQGKLVEAEAVAEKVLSLDPINSHAMAELLAVWKQQKKPDLCYSRFFAFINQFKYRFGRHSQAPFFRFLLCCRDFGMKKEAAYIFERFGSQLDDKNKNFYIENFT